MLPQKARFVCFLLISVGGLTPFLQISLLRLLRESFELTFPGNLSQEGVMKSFFTPGGWDEVKCVY